MQITADELFHVVYNPNHEGNLVCITSDEGVEGFTYRLLDKANDIYYLIKVKEEALFSCNAKTTQITLTEDVAWKQKMDAYWLEVSKRSTKH